MALTTNCTLIAALAALGPFAALGMQDPSMNTQVAFPKHVKESNTLGQLANSILAISEIATSSQAGVQAMTAPFVNTNCSGQEAAKSSLLTPPYVIKSLTPTTVKSSSMGFTYQIQLPAVKSGQTFTIQVPGYEVKSLNPLSSRSKSLGQVRSTTPSRRITLYENAPSPRLAGTVYEKKVSIRFANATAQKVLDWLTAQGISFAVDNSGISSDKRVTLNAVNKRLGDIISALGEAMGGQWVERNGFLVFRKGFMAFGNTAAPMPPFQTGGPDQLAPRSSIDEKIIELKAGDAKDPIINERQIQIEMEKVATDLAKSNLNMIQLQDRAKKVADVQNQALAEIRIADLQVDLEKIKQRRLDGDRENERRRIAQELESIQVNFSSFLDHITLDQVDKMHKRGYLLFSELSPVQLRTIGILPSKLDDLTLTVTKNGRSVTIKTK